MRLLAQLKASDLGRFKNVQDLRTYNEHFRDTHKPIEEALDAFRAADNTEADGNKRRGKVVLAGGRYTGKLKQTRHEVDLNCTSRMIGSRPLIYKEDSTSKTWKTGSNEVVEDKANGTVSAYTSEPEPVAPEPKKPTVFKRLKGWASGFFSSEPVEQPLPPQKPKPGGMEDKIHEYFDGRYKLVGGYNLKKVGRFETTREQQILQARQGVDKSLDFVKELMLETDQSYSDGNSEAGYVVLDGIRHAAYRPGGWDYSFGDGHLSNDPSMKSQLEATVRKNNRIRYFSFEAHKFVDGDKSIGHYGDLAYLEDKSSGEVKFFKQILQ